MKTGLQQAMTTGVFVEFRDEFGHTLGHAVYADWNHRAVPVPGDTMVCPIRNTTTQGSRKMKGTVRSRQFDVQQDSDGETSIWVYLVVEPPQREEIEADLPLGEFSPN